MEGQFDIRNGENRGLGLGMIGRDPVNMPQAAYSSPPTPKVNLRERLEIIEVSIRQLSEFTAQLAQSIEQLRRETGV